MKNILNATSIGFVTSFVFLAGIAQAAEPTTSRTTLEKVGADKKHDIQDIDKQVTDIKLRVDSGKKSRYSSTFNMSYMAGSLAKPSAADRPNVGDGRRVSPVTLSGAVGVRYRKNTNESFYIATGVSRDRPFHTGTGKEEWELSTPRIMYNKTHAVDDLQVSSSFHTYIATRDFNKAIGEVGTLGYSLIAKNKIAQSKLSGGVSLTFWYTFYDKDQDTPFFNVRKGIMETLGDVQGEYGVGLSPAVQYQTTEKTYVYTSLSLFNYSHYRADDAFKMENSTMTQSLGMGVAITRDFFLSPYITFEPENASSDRTSVSLLSTINL